MRLGHVHRVASFGGYVIDCGRTLQLVPCKWLALNRAFQGLDQHYGEQLPISETLQPHLAEQPAVFARFGPTTLESKCDRRCQEVNDQKGSKIHHQLYEIARVGGVRV